jgi:hypothetical protein
VLVDALRCVQDDLDRTSERPYRVEWVARDGVLWVSLNSRGPWMTNDSSFDDPREDNPCAAVADAVQEAIAELDWVVWPLCPNHGVGLHAAEFGDRAHWHCGIADGHVVSAIGSLGAEPCTPP